MLIIGFESSCDETGVAVACTQRGLLAHALHSQIAMHRDYGGVVPELASRDHIRRIVPLTRQVLEQAGVRADELDAVAYTAGPGLAGALLVGASFAQAFAWGHDLPAIPIHHLEGHLLSPLLADDVPEFPFVALLVSGGHTQLMRVDGVGRYTLLGETLDDAAGEGDGRGEEERVEARKIKTFAEERRGGEEHEALAGIGETREIGEDGGTFAAADGAVEAMESRGWLR